MCLSIAFTVNADKRRSCPVYNSNYTASIVSGYTMVQAGNLGTALVSIRAEAPGGTPNYNGNVLTVYVNALDRATGCIVSTATVRIHVERGRVSGQGSASFTGLTPGTYYDVSIDSASCE